MKTRFLKIRVDDELDKSLRVEADKRGITISDLGRSLLRRALTAQSQEQFLAKLDASVTAMSLVPTPAPASSDHEPVHAEVLLLLREIAGERNAQILARVTQQLNARYPERKKL